MYQRSGSDDLVIDINSHPDYMLLYSEVCLALMGVFQNMMDANDWGEAVFSILDGNVNLGDGRIQVQQQPLLDPVPLPT